MFGVIAGVTYLAAVILPIWLLYRFHSRSWYWHLLAVAVALTIGLMPSTSLLLTTAGTFLYGFVFFFLMVWGIGGLAPLRWHRKKLA